MPFGQGNFPAEFGTVNLPDCNGLPVFGRAFIRVGNGGVSANFGASREHRYTRPLPWCLPELSIHLLFKTYLFVRTRLASKP